MSFVMITKMIFLPYIPTTLYNNKKTLPEWTEHVEPCKQVTIYWHRCWKHEGYPHQGAKQSSASQSCLYGKDG